MSHDKGGWIGVDLDGTLAEYSGWRGPEHIGAPIPAMLERVRLWLEQGKDVRIFTARVAGDEAFGDARRYIVDWCLAHLGTVLPVTNVKDFRMVELWDDRAIQVRMNTGERVGDVAPANWKANWRVDADSANR